MTLGGASVGSYFENTLEEVREIEKKGLLKSPPASASFEAKDAIEFLGNSENIAKYVQSTLSLFKWCGVIFVGLVLGFFLTLFRRIYYRKSKFPDDVQAP